MYISLIDWLISHDIAQKEMVFIYYISTEID